MASLIPTAVKKVIADAYVAEPQWKVALFTTNDCLSRSTYGTCTGETSGTGYTTGGAVVTGRADSIVSTSVVITATNTAWTGATFSAAYAVVYETAGGLIRAVYDLGGTKTVTAGTFTLQWDASNGLVKIS